MASRGGRPTADLRKPARYHKRHGRTFCIETTHRSAFDIRLTTQSTVKARQRDQQLVKQILLRELHLDYEGSLRHCYLSPPRIMQSGRQHSRASDLTPVYRFSCRTSCDRVAEGVVIAVFEIVGTREFRRVEKMVARTAGISLKLFPNGNTTLPPQFPMLVCPSCGP